MAIDGCITVQEAADILGCSKPRIYRYIKLGRLPAGRIGQMFILSLEQVERLKPNLTDQQRGSRR